MMMMMMMIVKRCYDLTHLRKRCSNFQTFVFKLTATCRLRDCRNRPAPFPGRERRLNHALSVLSLTLDFLSMSVLLLTRATFRVVLFCVFCLFGCSC